MVPLHVHVAEGAADEDADLAILNCFSTGGHGEERAFGGDELGEFPPFVRASFDTSLVWVLRRKHYRSTKIGASEGCNTRLYGHLLQWEMNPFKHAAMTPATCGSLLFALI